MRRVMVRVLPVPAPASTHTGPRGAITASRCSSSRSSTRARNEAEPAIGAPRDMASILAVSGDKPRLWAGHVGAVGYVECAMSDQLTMYTTSWCGYCFRLKTALKSEGISWTEVDIEADSAAAEFVGSVNGGNHVVPTVKFADGSTLTNPSAKAVKAKLGR